MEIFVFWVALSVAIAVWASNKGRSGFGWFLFSVILSPLIAGIFLAIASDRSPGKADAEVTPQTHVRCPDCRELIRKDARKCKHCGTALIPQ